MKFYNFTSLLALPFAALFLSSCDKQPDITGSWTGTPVKINNVSSACDASATMTFSFTPTENKSNAGTFILSALIDANQPVQSGDSFIDQAYEVSVAATATVSGTWSFKQGEDDDIILSYDSSTLMVNVDPHGVTFTSNLLTGAQQPMIDSLSVETAAAWKKSLSRAISQEFYGIKKISDIKVHNDIMSCEIHDRDYAFRRVNN